MIDIFRHRWLDYLELLCRYQLVYFNALNRSSPAAYEFGDQDLYLRTKRSHPKRYTLPQTCGLTYRT